MIEVVEDAELFHEARNEVERSLAILHAIFELGITSLQAEPEIFEVEEIEDLTDDVRHGEILENAAIRLARQKPQPGHYLGVVVSEQPCVGAALRKAAHVAVDVTRRAVRKTKSDGYFLSDNVFENNGIVLVGQQIQFVAEQTRNCFNPGELLQQEHVLAERSVHGDEPMILTVFVLCHELILPLMFPSRPVP